MNHPLQRTRDAILVIRYQAGEDAALEHLVERHAKRVRSLIVRQLCGDVALVDDIAQNVWLQVVRGIGQLKNPLTLEAWLNRVALNQTALFLRRRQRPSVPLDLVSDQISINQGQEVDAESVQLAIARLESIHQTIIRVRYWESRTYQEISDHLQIPVGTVRSRLHTARKQLASIIRERETQDVTE